MEALLTLFAILLFAILVYKGATIALRRTGVPRDVAGFQAVSALTSTGFTTSESEYVVNHPVRRRIIQFLMIVGSTGLSGGIATLVLAFIGQSTTGVLLRLGVLFTGLLILYVFAKSDSVDKVLTRILTWFLDKFTSIRVVGYEAVTGFGRGYIVANLRVTRESWLEGKTIKEAGLVDEGVLVLGIYRRPRGVHAVYFGSPSPSDAILEGDELVLYGHEDTIENLSVRTKGPEGDKDHVLMSEAHNARRALEEAHARAG